MSLKWKCDKQIGTFLAFQMNFLQMVKLATRQGEGCMAPFSNNSLVFNDHPIENVCFKQIKTPAW